MKKEVHKTIWTIGHSTRTIEDFITLLQSHNIVNLVDVRHYPGSRRYPHFNKNLLSEALVQNNINYNHIVQLGGRRKAQPDSKNLAWRHPSFRSYADYMETSEFKEGIKLLEDVAKKTPTAFMCSEAVWWRCHRSMIADYLKANGWKVFHIMEINKAIEHPYTSPAKIIDGILSY